MKNLKSIALGLTVGAMAIGFSSFTNAKKAAGDVFAQETAGVYTKLPPSAPYNPANCDQSSNACSYEVTAAGASHVTGSSLNSSQIATDLSEGWIAQDGTATGIYSE